MVSRASGTPFRRARIPGRSTLTAALVVATLGASVLPALAAPAADDPAPVSAWGPGGPKAQMPEVKVGSNTPLPAEAEAPVSTEVAAWRAAQKERTEAGTGAGAAARSSAAVRTYVPEGQGAVPWH